MNEETTIINSIVVPVIYLASSVMFIFGLKRLGKVKTARSGNTLAAMAMLLAVLGTLIEIGTVEYHWIIAGLVIGGAIGAIAATKVHMTQMPEMVAIFNGTGGAASAAVAIAVVWQKLIETNVSLAAFEALGGTESITIGVSVIIGSITTSGSVIAYLKLQGNLNKGRPVLLPIRHVWTILFVLAAIGLTVYFAYYAPNTDHFGYAIMALTLVSLLLGILLVVPIGSGDMPVVISLLNSYSGLAACATGFVLNNYALIISGALVGSAGIILTHIMCVAMDRSLLNVLVGGFGAVASGGGDEDSEYTTVTSVSAEEMAMVLEDADSVIFVPGYGLAVAQAQHAVKELTQLLEKRGARVSFAIHPVAGRMPGHMNVLLAEADIPYENLFEMDHINSEFKTTDVAILLGANDVCNPVALTDPNSPIYGMPILNVHDARTVFIVKRSLSPGYAGIKNPLFEAENASMCYGDAKKIINEVIEEVRAWK